MVSSFLKGAGLACATVSLLIGSAPAVHADNLFDMLFGGGNRATSRARVEPQRGVVPQAPVQRRSAPPKISAPSYYTYKPAEPVHVDFSRIAPPPLEEAFQPMLDGAAFREALPKLAGFELFTEKSIAAALIEYYSKNPDFIWVSGYQPNKRAERALRVLAEAGTFGLSEADYTVGVPSADVQYDRIAERQQQLIRFEMALSARVLRYARDAYGGRIDPNKLSGYHDLPEKRLDLVQSLGFMARMADVDIYLERQHPQNGDYRALRAELETLRAAAEREIVVDPKTFVKPGGSDPEFAKLLKIIERDGEADFLAEHGAVLREHAGSEVYTDALVPLIKAVQESHGLKPDGVIGPRTVGAVAGESKAARIEKVLFALERLRWHPSKLGETRVVINAASFKVDFFDKEKLRLSMRTVVGSRSNQTSFFYDKLETVEFNPYWGVPRSILVNEMLPKLLRDPSYLDRNGYEVVAGSGKQVSSSSVDWGRYGSKIPFSVRQKPGPSNSLGELKILFPNRHAIYMHDTPSKSLFQRDTRAFSHGCVRLADPRAMAAAVLDISVEEVAASINSRGGQTTRRKIERDIPVYVGYFTAWPDAEADGRIAYHGDVYGRDERLRIALEKLADTRAPSS
ncbi:L,D-transpeptidase family protein [Nitratireductor pacificus]|uniref:ErfK/YbiS/YcfS/YnhG family protein n=1 Tax=Nitratireductor pacificus pht-3B TaxID=391937 RepID=K2LJJ1_9HYPH|nr:L,D-transpeptidase family protein [Nitratireductor pacificus]EKF17924.1 ErfK/YbiS/YcfS/YnhG family protein [Nitratireductor pacificus pht-3B]